MIRTIVAIACVCCVATVLSEGVGLAFLWYRGQLSADTLSEIRLVLSGESQTDFIGAEDDVSQQVSNDAVKRERAMQILDLTRREEENSLLKNMLLEQRGQVLQQRKDVEEMRKQFEQEMQLKLTELTDESNEQARGILLKLPPADAVTNLMQLDLDQNVVLLKGMADASVAKILQEFNKRDKDSAQRGIEVFEAIQSGEPTRRVIEQTANDFAQQTSPYSNTIDQ